MFLTRTRGHKRLDWTDWLSYVYLVLGLFLMFGPVLWIVMSSFKTQAALSEFPPTFLPFGQKTVKVEGLADSKDRLPVYRVGLTTIYCCGLRLSEGAELQVTHIDGARAMRHITGKGGKDRYVPLPEATLALLRDHWRTHRNPAWLFPAGGPHGEIPRGTATTPINRSSLQSAFTRAVEQGGVRKRAHVHTLRHRYATHLLEAGVTLRLIQEYLGHTSVKTTAVYTHLTRELQATALEPINALMTRR